MFYPVESLKRGGRFYLCWVADSWPLRFSAITHRQLLSQDIRELCDDLLEVMTNESGRPTNRFSLRLSSQLMRGLVRLYERKATILMSELCMINARIFKSTNRKFESAEQRPARRLAPLPPPPRAVVEELGEQRVEEMIQNSGNVVTNIQDITLKEAAIPEFQLPPNDNFGEENPNQALQLLMQSRTVEQMIQETGPQTDLLDLPDKSANKSGPIDRTIETMMHETTAAQISTLEVPDKSTDKSRQALDRTIELMMQDTSVAQLSVLELPNGSTDKSHDKSRSHHKVPSMEPITEMDFTFRKSTTIETLPAFEKDVPEIPEVLPPEIPAPTEPIPPEVEPEQLVPEVTEPIPAPPSVPAKKTQPRFSHARRKRVEEETTEESELEEVEVQPARKRRARTSLIIDKRIKLPSAQLRARIDNPHVEMRFEDSAEAIVDVRPTADALLHRAARASLSARLAKLFLRNFSYTHLPIRPQEQDLVDQPRQKAARAHSLEKITEAEEPPTGALQPTALEVTATTKNQEESLKVSAEAQNVTTGVQEVTGLNVPDVSNVDPNQMQVDIAELPTQILEMLSQARNRTGDYEIPAKRQRSVGYISFKEIRQHKSLQPPPQIVIDADKENIPPNIQEQSIGQTATHRPSVTLEQVPFEQPLAPFEHPLAPVEQQLAPVEQHLALVEPQFSPVEQKLAPVEQQLSPVEPQLGPVEQQLAPVEPQIAPIDQLELSQADASRMLKEAGLTAAKKAADSDSSETPLGSLDRTKVSLGDSVRTTDTQRFIRTEWGIEGTMTKVLLTLKVLGAGPTGRVTLRALLRPAPRPARPGLGRVCAARAFTSLLKLKQHGFVRIDKDPDTLEIRQISLGPRFDNM